MHPSAVSTEDRQKGASCGCSVEGRAEVSSSHHYVAPHSPGACTISPGTPKGVAGTVEGGNKPRPASNDRREFRSGIRVTEFRGFLTHHPVTTPHKVNTRQAAHHEESANGDENDAHAPPHLEAGTGFVPCTGRIQDLHALWLAAVGPSQMVRASATARRCRPPAGRLLADRAELLAMRGRLGLVIQDRAPILHKGVGNLERTNVAVFDHAASTALSRMLEVHGDYGAPSVYSLKLTCHIDSIQTRQTCTSVQQHGDTASGHESAKGGACKEPTG